MALSGTQKTRIGTLGPPGKAYSGFTAKAESEPAQLAAAKQNGAFLKNIGRFIG